jgi:catechol 2,3-dioxygenase-like lactoylglutathione lyase family enzyme
MKRLHVALAVADLEQSIRFYSTLFNSEPSTRKPDYAKWMLEDPKVNFSIAARGGEAGVDHLGIQVDDDGELGEVSERLEQAGQSLFKQQETTCCYARSNKAWVRDPQGVPWETFHTFDTSDVYGEDVVTAAAKDAPEDRGACCSPDTPVVQGEGVTMTTASAGDSEKKAACCSQ